MMDLLITDQVIIYLTNKLRHDREQVISVAYGSLGMVEKFTTSSESQNYAWELTASIVMQYLGIDFRINDYEMVVDSKQGLIDTYKLPHPYRPGGGNETNYSKMKHIMQLRFFFVPTMVEHRARLDELREDLKNKVKKS